MPIYARPPIVEAVVELRVATSLSEKDVRRAGQILKGKYPLSEDQSLVNFTVSPGFAPITATTFNGVKLTEVDQSEIAVISRHVFSRSMLPPYRGWPVFFASIQEDWAACSKIYGKARVSRIGLRYINRIDIPTHGANSVQMRDYVRAHVMVPDLNGGPLLEHNLRAVMRMPDPDVLCFINSGLVAPLVPETIAIALDIEVAQDQNLPDRIDQIWGRVETLREMKNSVFEACLTDNARKLFGYK